MGLTKLELAEEVQSVTGYTKKESSELIEAVFSIMKGTLETGESLKISGFGNFEVKQKADRQGRNPQTGEGITITSRRVMTFKPSAMLKQAINK